MTTSVFILSTLVCLLGACVLVRIYRTDKIVEKVRNEKVRLDNIVSNSAKYRCLVDYRLERLLKRADLLQEMIKESEVKRKKMGDKFFSELRDVKSMQEAIIGATNETFNECYEDLNGLNDIITCLENDIQDIKEQLKKKKK